MSRHLTPMECLAFLASGVRTGKLGLGGRSGPIVVPVWFVVRRRGPRLHDERDDGEGAPPARGPADGAVLRRRGFPFGFVGRRAGRSPSRSSRPRSCCRGRRGWPRRYVPADRAGAFGARNAVPGELLCRLRASASSASWAWPTSRHGRRTAGRRAPRRPPTAGLSRRGAGRALPSAHHGPATSPDRGLRRRRLLDGGRQPAAWTTTSSRSPARERPRVCFVPTASGDADHYVVRFYRAFAAAGCEPSHVSLFRRDRGAGAVEGDLAAHLLAQDLIYVGGGSVLSPARAPGARTASTPSCAEAWRRGTVLCGLSAGSLCWFAEAVTAFHGAPSASRASGLLPHSNCVHYDGEPARRDGVPPLRRRRHARRLRRRGRRGAALRRRRTSPGRHLAPRPRRLPRRRARRRRRWWRSPLRGRLPRRDRGGARAGRRRMTAPTILAIGGGGFTDGRRATRRSTSSSWSCAGAAVPRILLPAHGRRRRGAADRALPRRLRRPRLRARRPLALPPRPASAGRCGRSCSART